MVARRDLVWLARRRASGKIANLNQGAWVRGGVGVQIKWMQQNLACVAQRFVYTTIYGQYGSEDGANDALESTLQTLRRRLKIHNQGDMSVNMRRTFDVPMYTLKKFTLQRVVTQLPYDHATR